MRPKWADIKKGDLVKITYALNKEAPPEIFLSWITNIEDNQIFFSDYLGVTPDAFLDQYWDMKIRNKDSRFTLNEVLGNMDKDKIYSFMTKNYPEYSL